MTVPGRVYEIGSNVVDLANDLQTGNFDNTVNNVVDRVAPKGLQKIGIPKTASELIPGTISLGNKLSNDN